MNVAWKMTPLLWRFLPWGRLGWRPLCFSTYPDWVHEIKHDGYRLIVRRDGPVVRQYSRNGIDLTARLSAIAAAAVRIAQELHDRWRGRCAGA
jgi:hypothetical protein